MKYILILASILFYTTSIGQINVGSKEYVTTKAGKLKADNIHLLKKSKTIFVYREQDEKNLDQFKSLIDKSWDYTDLEFVSFDDFKKRKFNDAHYSFFTLGGFHKVKTSSSGMVTELTYIYMSLWMYIDGKKKTFCRIEFYPTFKTHNMAAQHAGGKDGKMMTYLYEDAVLHNWNLAYINNAIQTVNKKLSHLETRWLYKSSSKISLAPLKRATLYVPDYTLIKFNKKTGDESLRHLKSELFKKYPYKYKIIDPEELSDLIVNSDEPIYYLSYIKSSTDKYVTVINGLTGEIMYSEYSAMSYNLKTKDITKVAGKIK